jgi:hypothetical protein
MVNGKTGRIGRPTMAAVAFTVVAVLVALALALEVAASRSNDNEDFKKDEETNVKNK